MNTSAFNLNIFDELLIIMVIKTSTKKHKYTHIFYTKTENVINSLKFNSSIFYILYFYY